jgi:hypothetical protein
MTATVTIEDKTSLNFASRSLTFVLPVPARNITVRELIRARVRGEVEVYNRRLPEYFHGLIQPTGAEATLNGFRMRVPRTLDWESQLEKALEAFECSGFIILVDGQQVESLDETIEAGPETTVAFLKLVPLVGG